MQAAEIGTKGWVYNGPQLYAAKIEQIDPVRGYLVHYEGWKRKWDEWIFPHEFLEDNEENRAKSDQLKNANKQRKPSTTSSPPSEQQASKRVKTGSEALPPTRDLEDFIAQSQEVEEIYNETGMRVTLPEDLKLQVVHNWEQFVQHDLQVQLPCAFSVRKILQMYAESKKTAPQQASCLQFSRAMEIYFNRALPQVLLLKGEARGYEPFVEQELGDRFGGEHLLRMCVRLPHLMLGLDEQDAKQLCVRVNDLLKFMSRRKKDFFGRNVYVKKTEEEDEEDEVAS